MNLAGRPRVLHRRLVRDATEDEREHERDVAKAASDSTLVKTALDGVLRRAPDLALLGGGYYLGAVMNMRPGFTIPLPTGNVFFGFPDFGGKIDELRADLQVQQDSVDNVEKKNEQIRKDLAACLSNCPGPAFPEDRDQCIQSCKLSNVELDVDILKGPIAQLKADLRKHTIAQGILMATIVYAVTRAGFIAGVGEILPG